MMPLPSSFETLDSAPAGGTRHADPLAEFLHGQAAVTLQLVENLSVLAFKHHLPLFFQIMKYFAIFCHFLMFYFVFCGFYRMIGIVSRAKSATLCASVVLPRHTHVRTRRKRPALPAR
jgi:hypothetical protein